VVHVLKIDLWTLHIQFPDVHHVEIIMEYFKLSTDTGDMGDYFPQKCFDSSRNKLTKVTLLTLQISNYTIRFCLLFCPPSSILLFSQKTIRLSIEEIIILDHRQGK